MEESFRQIKSSIVRVVLFGPESTGKTTLSKQLAQHYKTVWVPEYAREYLQKKWDEEKKICQTSDILPIAKGQISLENTLIQQANRVIICDTNLLETKVYSEVYYGGYVDPTLNAAALYNHYDLYLLTYIDVPWEADDLRDEPNQRFEMFEVFKATLVKNNKPFIQLEGNQSKRLNKSIDAIDTLLT